MCNRQSIIRRGAQLIGVVLLLPAGFVSAQVVGSENFTLDEFAPVPASSEMQSEDFQTSVAVGDVLATSGAQSESFTLKAGVISTRMNLLIDVMPGSDRNPINTKRAGVIPVAILSSDSFDATQDISFDSLTFGYSGDENSLTMCSDEGDDVNGDGLPDLMCHFDVGQSGFALGDSLAVLKGSTVDAVTAFIGTDQVDVIK